LERQAFRPAGRGTGPGPGPGQENALIVPTGAKEPSYCTRIRLTERNEAEEAETPTAPSSGLVDVTDNIVDEKVAHPREVVCRDGDDAYLVVAPTKAPARFPTWPTPSARKGVIGSGTRSPRGAVTVMTTRLSP